MFVIADQMAECASKQFIAIVMFQVARMIIVISERFIRMELQQFEQQSWSACYSCVQAFLLHVIVHDAHQHKRRLRAVFFGHLQNKNYRPFQ